jgi:predicted RNase H-like HicB family nuclease
MKSIIQFTISKEGKNFIAEGVNVPVVTQAKSFDELTKNIREALDLFFEGQEAKELGFSGEPAVLANFEIPAVHYA